MVHVVISMILIGAEPVPQVDASWRNVLEHVVTSIVANRSSFRYGVFHYDRIIGNAESLQDAAEGRIQKAYTGKCYYAFSGSLLRMENLFTLDDMIRDNKTEKKGDGSIVVTSMLNSYRSLCDGKVTLRDEVYPGDGGKLFHQPQIFAGDFVFYGSYQFPLDLGRSQSGYVLMDASLRRILRGEYELKEFNPHDTTLGLDLVKITYSYGSKGETSLWIDLARGCVPIQSIFFHPKRGASISDRYDDIVQIQNAGWIPRKKTTFLNRSKRFDQIILTSIQCDQKPERSVFQLEFSQPIGMIDAANKAIYKPRKVWNLTELPARGSSQSRSIEIQAYTPPPPAHPERNDGKSAFQLGYFVRRLDRRDRIDRWDPPIKEPSSCLTYTRHATMEIRYTAGSR